MKAIKKTRRRRSASLALATPAPTDAALMSEVVSTVGTAPIMPDGAIARIPRPPGNASFEDYVAFMERVLSLDALCERGKAYVNWLTGTAIVAVEKGLGASSLKKFRARFHIGRSKYYDCRLVAGYCTEDEARAPGARYGDLLKLARQRSNAESGAAPESKKRTNRPRKVVPVSEPKAVGKVLDRAERAICRIQCAAMLSAAEQPTNARKMYETMRELATTIIKRCTGMVASLDEWLGDEAKAA